MSNIKRLLGLAALLLFIVGIVFPQSVGDYRSRQSTNWGVAGTSTAWSRWDGTQWRDTTAVPDQTSNVTIQNGHTIVVEVSPKYCNNLTVENNAQVYANSVVTSPRYIRMYGTTVTVNGRIGAVSGSDALGLGFYTAGTVTITGSGTVGVSRIQPTVAGITVIFDANTNIWYAGSNGAGSTGLYSNGLDNIAYTINVNKTVTMACRSYVSAHSSSGSSAGTGNFTLDVYGTLTTGGTAHINLNTASGKTSTLHVYNGGTINVGDTANIRADVVGATYTITVDNGGTINGGNNSGGQINFAAATPTVNGTVDFKGTSTSTRTLGTATVGSTGKLRFKDGTYPTGITLNSGSTVEYYGTSGITLGSTPTSYSNLLLTNSGGLTLGASPTVSGTLALQGGNISTGSNTLIIGSGGNVLRTTGYVIGSVQKTVSGSYQKTGNSADFEVGTANGYSPVNLRNVSGSGTFTAKAVGSAHSPAFSTNSLNEYWTLTNGGLTSADLTLHYLNGDVVGNESNYALRKYASGLWTSPGGTVDATGDSATISGVSSFSNWTLGECPTISLSASLSNGTVGTPYSDVVTASGGNGPYTYSVTTGTPPPGLNLAGGGTLSGTPTAAVVDTFTVTTTDNAGCTGSRQYIITMSCPTITVNPSSVPNAGKDTPYGPQIISASGGTAPYSYSVSFGSPPPGINLSNDTLSGTPTTVGTYNFTITATDNYGCTGSRAYSIVVSSCPVFSFAPASFSNLTQDVAYVDSVRASNGSAPYAYTLDAGAMPTNLNMDGSGNITGTPTVAGVYNFTVKATDDSGCVGTKAYTMVVCGPFTIGSLPNGTVGSAYSSNITVSGGTAPYADTVIAGNLPAGLTLSSGGTLSGIPTAAGPDTFTVGVTDANGCTGSKEYILTMSCPTITVTNLAPDGIEGYAYNHNYTISGGTSPYRFIQTGGSLPTGLNLSIRGNLSGTPSVAGTYPFTFSVEDTFGCIISFDDTVDIITCPTITLLPAPLPNGTRGSAYSQTITVSAGTEPIRYTVPPGSLPANLSLDIRGLLSGTPTTVGNYNFTITATDTNGCTGNRAYTLTILRAIISSNGSGGGSWASIATWSPQVVPINPDTVTILGNDSVYILSNATCGGLNIQSSGKLSLSAKLTPTNVVVNGTVIVFADSIKPSGTMTVTNGGVYRHARDGGKIPVATWNTGSTLLVTGVLTTTNIGGSPNQNYYNIVWNCPSQTANTHMGMHATAQRDTTSTINGDVTVISTGTGRMHLCGPPAGLASAHTISRIIINGNIYVSGTAQFTAHGSSSVYTDIFTTVMGNINVTGGNFSVSRGSQTALGTTIWYLKGDFSMSNATTQNSNTGPAGSAKFVFNKTGTQTLTLGSGNTLTALPIEVASGTALNMGVSRLRGSDIFTLNSGATLLTANTGGLDSAVSVGGTKTLSSGANYVFNGASAQVTGKSVPLTVNNLTINNSNGVTLDTSLTVNGIFTLSSGNLTTNQYILSIATAGSVSRTSGHVVGNLQKGVTSAWNGVLKTFEIGVPSAYLPVDVKYSTVSAPGNLLVKTTSIEHPNIGTSGINPDKSVNRYYTFTNDVIGFDNYDATFRWATSDVDPPADWNKFVVVKYDVGTWHGLTEGVRTSNSIQVTGVSSICDFAIGEPIFTITATSGLHGTINPSGAVMVEGGRDTTFVFTPDECYQVDSVFVDGGYVGSMTSYPFTNVSSAHTIHVTFAIIPYTITVTQHPNGTIDPGTVSVNCGDNKLFTITPGEGYHTDSVVVDAENKGVIPTYEFVNVTANHAITAYFSISTYTLQVDTVGKGTVTVNPEQAQYDYNQHVELHALPGVGWLFSSWSGDTTGTGNPVTITMTSGKHIIATFTIDPQYEVTFRTATYSEWATAPDAKGKYKAIKRKNDKVELKFNLVSPKAATGVKIKFGMLATGALTAGKDKLVQLGDSILNVKEFTYTGVIDSGDTIQFDGFGWKGKVAKVKLEWATLPRTTKVTVTDYKMNYPQLPMPNLHNIGEEVFGSGQTSYFPSGLLVGVPQGEKKAKSVIHLKYKDVQKSMVKVKQGSPTLHTDSIRCLDKFPANGRAIDKQQKSLPPDKYSNKLFAELLTLKMNIAASGANKFPNGLGELTFSDPSDPANPFNGQTLNTIIGKADSMISCLTLLSKTPVPTLTDLYDVLKRINGVFSGVIDTVSFATKTQFTGVVRLIDVPFLQKTPGLEPISIQLLPVFVPEPTEYTLEQNYPNPFNPTTTIQFALVNPAVVTLKVYNMLGQEVATLINREMMDEGTQEIEFNASNLSSGVYFYRLVAEQQGDNDEGIPAMKFQTVKKMLLVK